MATYGDDKDGKDAFMTCPFDESHRMKESRYQIHVAKCEKNHLDVHLATCPFNAQHRPHNGELNHHLLHCECRTTVDKQLIASTDSTYRGHVGVPSYHSQPVESGENWDIDINQSASGYSPSVVPPSGGIRTDFSGMKPSERRKYYETLSLKKDAESDVNSEKNTLPELREPKTLSHTQMLEQREPIHELQNIGLGRGQPVASSSRIAANIFGQQPAPIRQPRSAPQIPGFRVPNLGMGRGSHADNGDDEDNLSGQKQETEIIPIGRGRGKRRN